MGHIRTFHEQEVQSSTTETGAGTSEKTFSSKTAQSIEAWIEVTAITGGGDFTFNLQTSIDETNFATIAQEVNVTATGTFPLVVNRFDDPIAILSRVTWIKNAGTNMTFSIRMGRME